MFAEVEMDEEESDTPQSKKYLLCKLCAGKTDAMRVETKLFSSDNSKIFVKGAGEVHLTGYLEPDRTFDDILFSLILSLLGYA